MTFSEAIRLGALLKPQGIGAFESKGKTCAGGAALDAIGRLETDGPAAVLYAEWPITMRLVPHPTVPSLDGYNVLTIVAHLNDSEGWSREAIADWIEGLEAQHPPAPVSDCYDYATPALTWMDVERLR